MTPKSIEERSREVGNRIVEALFGYRQMTHSDVENIVPFIADALREVRAEAIEEAAKVLVERSDYFGELAHSSTLDVPGNDVRCEILGSLAREIRALGTKEEDGNG